VNQRPARRRQQSGFTMVELLVTLVVTVFGLMGAMALHASLARGNENAGRTNEATAVGTQLVESLRGARSTDMMKTLTGASTTLPPVDLTGYSTVLGRNGMSYRLDVHVAEVSGQPNLWRIRVEVKWTDDNGTSASSTSATERMIPFEVIRTMQEAL
jgi:prepilin-type N-terminal cleavage/methylation domain-containing protein